MAPKKTQLKSLKKGVNAKRSSAVKGGATRQTGPTTPATGKLAVNHNLVVI